MDLSSERMIEELLVISAQIPKEKKPKQLKVSLTKNGQNLILFEQRWQNC